MMFSHPPPYFGEGEGGNSGAQAVLSAHALINADGLEMRLDVVRCGTLDEW